jgi:hypothetical protein
VFRVNWEGRSPIETIGMVEFDLCKTKKRTWPGRQEVTHAGQDNWPSGRFATRILEKNRNSGRGARPRAGGQRAIRFAGAG